MAASAERMAFAEHISELRKRFMWVLLFVFIGGVIGYLLNDTLMRILQEPLHDSLYYNNPGGAFSFIMKLCVVFGIIVALPMLSYQVFAFFGPIIATRTKRATVLYISMSVLLAALGILFAYFVSLPASLHFLTTFGQGSDIHALITANEYFNFVLAYVAGFAILFQVPLIITFTNRVTPLPPKKLLGGTRYVIVLSFIIAAIITPTPDPMNQAIMAVPIIALYLFSVAIVAFQPKRLRHNRQTKMALKKAAQQEQFAPIAQPRPVLPPAPVAQPKPVTQPIAQAVRPRPQTRLISDFAPRKTVAPQPRPLMDVTARPVRPIVGA